MAPERTLVRRKQVGRSGATYKQPSGGFAEFSTRKDKPADWDSDYYYSESEPETVEPQIGIHSAAWAQAIVPQADALFVTLTAELREKIYLMVIHSFEKHPTNYLKHMVQAVKVAKKNKFRSPTWIFAGKDTEGLLLTCRQMYADVTGGALIYKNLPFYFPTATSLLNYVPVINPFHKDSIKTVRIRFTWNRYNTRLSPICLEHLSDMAGLENLILDFAMNAFGRDTKSFNVSHLLGRFLRDRSLETGRGATFFEHTVLCDAMIGNGKIDGKGGHGGIRGLKNLEVNFLAVGSGDVAGWMATATPAHLQLISETVATMKSIMVGSKLIEAPVKKGSRVAGPVSKDTMDTGTRTKRVGM